MTKSPRTISGFTLIEVMVSLALMAMISTILITSLQIGGHTWQRITRATSGIDDIAQGQAFLREHLSSLYPYERGSTDTMRPGFLESDGAMIEFLSPSPDALANGIMRYRLAVSPATGALEVQSRLDRDGVPDLEHSQWANEQLLPHVAEMSVSFLLKPEGAPARWVDRWTDMVSVPRLIKIDVEFEPKDPRRWSTLYIEPRVDTPVTCEFDVVSRRCRSKT